MMRLLEIADIALTEDESIGYNLVKHFMRISADFSRISLKMIPPGAVFETSR